MGPLVWVQVYFFFVNFDAGYLGGYIGIFSITFHFIIVIYIFEICPSIENLFPHMVLQWWSVETSMAVGLQSRRPKIGVGGSLQDCLIQVRLSSKPRIVRHLKRRELKLN